MIEKILTEICRLKKDLEGYSAVEALDYIESYINILQRKQPEVDLEKEIDACWQNWLSPSNQKEVEGVLPKTEFAMYARHFYELGQQSRPKVSSNSLDDEIDRLWESFSEEMSGPHNLFDMYRRLARHFAEWGAEHLK